MQDLSKFLQDLIKTLQDLPMIPDDCGRILENLAKNPSERSCQDPQILAYVVAIIAMNCVFLAIELVAFRQNPTKPLQAIANHR